MTKLRLENGAEIKKYCGKLSKKQLMAQTITSSGNSIDVDFDGKVSNRGFKLKIKAVPENSPKAVSFHVFSSDQSTDFNPKVRALASSGNHEKLSQQSVEQLVTRFEKIWSILRLKLGVSDV